MAQTGYTPIQLYRTATASAAPTSGNLADGELAINTLDGKLFYKDSSGNVQTIATKGAGTIGGSTTQVQFNSSGALGGSASLTWDGTTLTSANSITSPVHKSATTLSLQTNGTTTGLYIDASQNVGIGTSSPTQKLQVYTASATATYGSFGNSANTGGMTVGADATGWAYAWNTNSAAAVSHSVYGNSSTNNTGSALFYTSASERMRIDSSGNVGIGTTSASSYGTPLSIYAATNPTLAIVSGNANAYLKLYSTSDNNMYLTNTGGSMTMITANSERMRIDSSGNVGIGTSSPSQKLDVNGLGRMRFTSGTGAGHWLDTIGNASRFFVGSDATAEAWRVYDSGGGGANRIYLDSSGNVGIGTSSPSASAILDAQSTTKGVRFPNMTTTQKNAISSPAAGLVVFDTTLAKLCVYSGSAWQTVTSV